MSAKDSKTEKETSTKSAKKGSILMTILKGLGIVILVLVLAGVAAWKLMLTPVNAKSVCSNLVKVTKADAKAQKGLDITDEQVLKVMGFKSIDDCASAEEASRKRSYQGLIRLTKKSKCEVKATSVAEFKECGVKTNKFKR